MVSRLFPDSPNPINEEVRKDVMEILCESVSGDYRKKNKSWHHIAYSLLDGNVSVRLETPEEFLMECSLAGVSLHLFAEKLRMYWPEKCRAFLDFLKEESLQEHQRYLDYLSTQKRQQIVDDRRQLLERKVPEEWGGGYH